MKRMIFKAIEGVDNVYGWKKIEFIQFNHDGKGAALAFCDGELYTFVGDDVHNIMCGDAYSGEKAYELEEYID